MEATRIIHKPLVTEKTTFEAGELNRVSFIVDRHATKPEIKQAVEELYKVRVLAVATQNRKGQKRRNKFGYWRSKEMKRATVKVHPDDRIELF